MSATQGQLDWLVNDFTRDTPGVLHALVVSGDGLLLASSAHVDVTLGDQLSAATSGLVSLSRGAAQLLSLAPVSQTLVEMTGGYLFATSISQGSTLAVVAQRHCDMGMVGYEMTMLASRVGHALTRHPADSAMTADGDYGWREGGRVVSAYAFTQGRTRTGGQELPLEALVAATGWAVENLPTLQVEPVRNALALPVECPLIRMDAREVRTSLDTLVTLVEHALVRSTGVKEPQVSIHVTGGPTAPDERSDRAAELS